MKVKKIISFEASPINFEFLKKKQKVYAKKFSDTEIIIENIALGSENKMMEFKHFNESSSSTIKNINEESKYFKRKFNLLNLFNKGKIYQTFQIKIQSLKEYIESNNIINSDHIITLDKFKA